MTSYDTIVVGAGSAGCVLANRLTEDADTRVLLLEAGGRDRHPWLKMPIAFVRMSWHRNYTWRFDTEPEPGLAGRVMRLRRGKVLGGTSTINGLIFARGHRRDYDLWRQQGLYGWSYADVLPYFRKLESSWRGADKFHGGDGPVAVTQVRHRQMHYEALEQAARNYGLPVRDDYNGAESEGVSRLELSVGDGERQSTARAYLAPAMTRRNLTVATRALTTRIIVERGRAIGIEYRQDGELKRAYAEREVILSGGSYNSPQLLMLSGIGPADHLREVGIEPVHDLPGVGANLSEHPNFTIMYRAKGSGTFLEQLRLDRATWSGLRWHLMRDGPFVNVGAGAVVFLKSRDGLERPDVQLVCLAIANDSTLWFPGLTKPPLHRFTVRVGTLYPRSRGWVKLRSADPAATPRIFFNMFGERDDLDDMVRAIRLARELYATEPQKSLMAEELFPGARVGSDPDLENAVRRYAENRQHPVGTCAMGLGDMAVVDPQLRVRGIEGLRVVDASVMPDEPGGNTNIPTIMIAEKAADLIRGRTLPPAEL